MRGQRCQVWTFPHTNFLHDGDDMTVCTMKMTGSHTHKIQTTPNVLLAPQSPAIIIFPPDIQMQRETKLQHLTYLQSGPRCWSLLLPHTWCCTSRLKSGWCNVCSVMDSTDSCQLIVLKAVAEPRLVKTVTHSVRCCLPVCGLVSHESPSSDHTPSLRTDQSMDRQVTPDFLEADGRGGIALTVCLCFDSPRGHNHFQYS